jgi:chaperonin GroES
MTVFEPYEDRILVLADPTEEKTPGGVIIPKSAQKSLNRGTVVAVGPGEVQNGFFVPVRSKPGDRVLYGKYSATTITLDGIDYLVMRDKDVYGGLTGEPDGVDEKAAVSVGG